MGREPALNVFLLVGVTVSGYDRVGHEDSGDGAEVLVLERGAGCGGRHGLRGISERGHVGTTVALMLMYLLCISIAHYSIYSILYSIYSMYSMYTVYTVYTVAHYTCYCILI